MWTTDNDFSLTIPLLPYPSPTRNPFLDVSRPGPSSWSGKDPSSVDFEVRSYQSSKVRPSTPSPSRPRSPVSGHLPPTSSHPLDYRGPPTSVLVLAVTPSVAPTEDSDDSLGGTPIAVGRSFDRTVGPLDPKLTSQVDTFPPTVDTKERSGESLDLEEPVVVGGVAGVLPTPTPGPAP